MPLARVRAEDLYHIHTHTQTAFPLLLMTSMTDTRWFSHFANVEAEIALSARVRNFINLHKAPSHFLTTTLLLSLSLSLVLCATQNRDVPVKLAQPITAKTGRTRGGEDGR